jgi:ribosomal protein S18 acetylase RimI-like enzyme
LPQIHVRRFLPPDLPAILAIDHNYTAEFVWQMEVQDGEAETLITFRERRLPRVMRQQYPRDFRRIAEDWKERWGILVGVAGEDPQRPPAGYAVIDHGADPSIARITDLAVAATARRQGVAAALVLSAEDWAAAQGCAQIMFEMQSKNHPAIRLAQKLGYEFCGYNDRHYPNKDIALYFGKSIT